MHLRHRLLLLYAICCAFALTYPGFGWLGNRLRPTVLGLPLSFFYNIAWVLLTFVVLVCFYLSEEAERP